MVVMDSIINNVYTKSVFDNFKFIKESKNIQEAYLKAISIADKGFLVPVCRAHVDDEELLHNLTEWRNENVHVYPSQFEATVESTQAWLKKGLLDVEDRILFLVVDNSGRILGHMGFNSCNNESRFFEVDNVIRGISSDNSKGLFSTALLAMMEWARTLTNVEGFVLRVMSDNEKAIDFYAKLGFIEKNRIPLVGIEKDEGVFYRPAEVSEDSDKTFIQMIFSEELTLKPNSMILTAGPSISQKEAAYAYDAAKNGWNSQWSKYLSAFESKFADYVGTQYAIATSSCTGALQIALMALDIGPGDEVIVPDQTWVATAKAVTYVGATPVFADIERDTWNLDANSVESLITEKTKAIMPVHMYGHPTRMDAIVDLAEKYNLRIVEDAAPAIGAEWNGKRCGSFGDFAGFSFQGAKLMVTGEGGMLVTNNKELYEKALKISDQGRNPSKTFWIDGPGVKFKMSNVQAAVGLAQLERVDELIELKRRVFSWYKEGLEGVPFVKLNQEVKGARSIYWMSSILLEGSPISRDQLIQQLKEHNVDSRPVFPAISQYPIWERELMQQPMAKMIGENAINLPSGVCLTKQQVLYVCKTIKKILLQ